MRDDYYICPITDDPASPTKEICNYLQNLIHNNKQQLPAASPKNSFQYKVRGARSLRAFHPLVCLPAGCWY